MGKFLKVIFLVIFAAAAAAAIVLYWGSSRAIQYPAVDFSKNYGALALLQNPNRSGSNGFQSLWLAGLDASGARRRALVDSDAQAAKHFDYADLLALGGAPSLQEASAGNIARSFPSRSQTPSAFAGEPPGFSWCEPLLDNDAFDACVAKVNAAPEAYESFLKAKSQPLKDLEKLASYGHFTDPFLGDSTPAAAYFPAAHVLAYPQTLAVSLFERGEYADAFGAVCANAALGRKLMQDPNSSAHFAQGAILLQSSSFAFLQMLSRAPSDAPVPESCPEAFSELSNADASICSSLARDMRIAASALNTAAPAPAGAGIKEAQAREQSFAELGKISMLPASALCNRKAYGAVMSDSKFSEPMPKAELRLADFSRPGFRCRRGDAMACIVLKTLKATGEPRYSEAFNGLQNRALDARFVAQLANYLLAYSESMRKGSEAEARAEEQNTAEEKAAFGGSSPFAAGSFFASEKMMSFNINPDRNFIADDDGRSFSFVTYANGKRASAALPHSKTSAPEPARVATSYLTSLVLQDEREIARFAGQEAQRMESQDFRMPAPEEFPLSFRNRPSGVAQRLKKAFHAAAADKKTAGAVGFPSAGGAEAETEAQESPKATPAQPRSDKTPDGSKPGKTQPEPKRPAGHSGQDAGDGDGDADNAAAETQATRPQGAKAALDGPTGAARPDAGNETNAAGAPIGDHSEGESFGPPPERAPTANYVKGKTDAFGNPLPPSNPTPPQR